METHPNQMENSGMHALRFLTLVFHPSLFLNKSRRLRGQVAIFMWSEAILAIRDEVVGR